MFSVVLHRSESTAYYNCSDDLWLRLFEMVVTVRADRQWFAIAVQHGYALTRGNAGADVSDGDMGALRQLLNA